MKVTGFLDFQGESIEEQIEVGKKLNIKRLLVRTFDGKNIVDITSEEIKIINMLLKEEKAEILAIDPLIEEYDLYNVDEYYDVYEKYSIAIEKANELKVKYVFYRLPKIEDILMEFDTLNDQLSPLIELARKNNKTLVIIPEDVKANALVYILKKYESKNLEVLFSPKQHVLQSEPALVSYRLLRNDFTFFNAADIDKKNNPELLGYGKVNIIDIFKRMRRDKFKGFVILDDSFPAFLKGEQEIRRPWYKRIFKSNNSLLKQYLRGYSFRIFPRNPEKEVDILDIYQNQIQVLSIVFKINQ